MTTTPRDYQAEYGRRVASGLRRDYKAIYARRNELARQAGYVNYPDQRQARLEAREYALDER